MRLSFIVELLLVFLFLAFAAAGVIESKDLRKSKAKKPQKRQGALNRYCACSANQCNCCRDFSLPVVPIKGPGCATLQYLQGDNMMVSMSFGERVLANRTISGKKPKPVCMGLPGGISQFCGRVYGISRSGEDFKACLGLELRALDDIEAALRVSCFKFSPKGVNLEAAQPVPTDEKEKEDEESDEDDYGLDDDSEEDDEDDDDGDDAFGLDVEEDEEEDGEDNEVEDSADYTGFSVLGEDIFGGLFGDDDSGNKKKKKIKTAKPIKDAAVVSTTTRRPLLPISRPTLRPNPPRITITQRPLVNRVTLRPKKPLKEIIRPTGVPAVITQEFTTPAAVKLTTTEATASPTESSNLKSTEAPIEVSTPKTTPTTTKVPEIKESTTTPAPSSTDPTIPLIDVAKVEAVAAMAQQSQPATVLVTPGTTPPSKAANEEVAVVEMVKDNLKVAPEEDDADDEDDLFEGMIDEVAKITGGSVDKKKTTKPLPKKPVTSTTKKPVDNTKKGDLPSSSINAKPVKKPVEDDSDDDIDFLSGVVGDDEEESEEESTEEEVDESVENNSIKKPTKVENDEDYEDDDDGDDLLDSIIGGDDDDNKNNKNTVTKSDQKKKKPVKQDQASEESEEDEESDENDEGLLSGVVDDESEEDDEKETKPSKKPSEKPNLEDEDDLFGVLDVDDDDDDDDDENETAENDNKAPAPTASILESAEEKPEANLVDSDEVKEPNIDEVTDYDSGEKKQEVTTSHVEELTVATEESVSEKAASDLSEEDEEEEDEDVGIEGDIGLGGDDEDRQIKKIRHIVAEAKKGRSQQNWFLRPAWRFTPEVQTSSMRGRSSRVHRRMNLDNID